MSKKRFTDTEVWEKDWFHELSCIEKLAWFYIKDKCNNVGLWSPNYTVANLFIGKKIDWDGFAGRCNGNVHILESGKWWLVDFCKFQHPDLKPESEGNGNKAVQSYIKVLQDNGLWELFKARATGVQGAYYAPKEQERVKDREKEQEEEKEKLPFREIIDYLNEKSGKGFKYGAEHRSHVSARFADGFCLDDFKRVIDYKCDEWLGTDSEKFLRPSTLFGTKFDGYLNSAPKPNPKLAALMAKGYDVKMAQQLYDQGITG